MNKLKSNKGITLVALIITVIVLLILTVVGIRAITGDGVLEKAKTATNSYEEKRRQEENMLGSYADMIDANMPQNTTTGGSNENEEEYIRQLYEKGMKGDTEAQKEVLEIIKTAALFNKKNNENEMVLIVETNNNIYEYYVDTTTLEILILDESYEYYSEVMKYEEDFYATRTAFIGKNIGDFEQEQVDETHWKIKNVPNMYATEIQVQRNISDASILYDATLGYSYFYLESDSFSIVDGKLTGVITDVSQD